MSTTSMAIFSNPLFATYSVYARNASIIDELSDLHLVEFPWRIWNRKSEHISWLPISKPSGKFYENTLSDIVTDTFCSLLDVS